MGLKMAMLSYSIAYGAPIAQLVEQLPFKEMVPGSNPGGGTYIFILLLILSGWFILKSHE